MVSCYNGHSEDAGVRCQGEFVYRHVIKCSPSNMDTIRTTTACPKYGGVCISEVSGVSRALSCCMLVRKANQSYACQCFFVKTSSGGGQSCMRGMQASTLSSELFTVQD